MTKTMTDATFGLDEAKIAELNAVVDRAQAAAAAFRKLDQKAVDDIVLAMVVAGLDVAIDLAGVAMEETGFGVFEDKVIKNYLATEFLYNYLKDKKTVGVVDHDEEANIDYVAEPIGVVMAITPITNPTSTVLFKAIVAAKTRNAIIFRPSPHAVRSAERSAAVIREAGEKVGLPPGTIQVVPDREHEPTHYLFKHPGINFIWTTGGPTIVELANSAGGPDEVDPRVLEQVVGRLMLTVGHHLNGAGRQPHLLARLANHRRRALRRTHGVRGRPEDDRVAGLGRDDGLEQHCRGRVGDRCDGHHDTDRLGDVVDVGLFVVVDDADGLLVLEVVVEELGGQVVLDDLVLEDPEAGLFHRHPGEIDGDVQPGDHHGQDDVVDGLLVELAERGRRRLSPVHDGVQLGDLGLVESERGVGHGLRHIGVLSSLRS